MPVNIVCVECQALFSVIPYRAKTAKYCCYRCHQAGEGRKGGRVRAEQMRAGSDGKSYRKLNGRHKHRIIAEEKLGRPLEAGEVVHHVNGNKFDNDPDNIIVTTQADHIRLHLPDMLKARKAKHGY